MTAYSPLVTVVRPVRESWETIERCILSVTAQSYQALFFTATNALAKIVPRLCAGQFSAIVGVAAMITSQAARARRFVVRNFPNLEDIVLRARNTERPSTAEPSLLYEGSITELRGISPLVKAIGRLAASDARSGRQAQSGRAKKRRRAIHGWDRTRFVGWVPRSMISDLTTRARAGVVTFLPAPNHLDSQPNKLLNTWLPDSL